jgi:hypothetical protein
MRERDLNSRDETQFSKIANFYVYYTKNDIITSAHALVTALSKSENFIINKFVKMYDFANNHKKNQKAAKKSLIDLFDKQFKLIINEIKVLKTGDENANVESEANHLLKNIINIDSNDDNNGSELIDSQTNNIIVDNNNSNVVKTSHENCVNSENDF